MLPYLRDHFGNPSSIHAAGRAARNAVDEARDRVAGVLGAAAREVIFTSGGSEADNLALRGAVERGDRGRHLVITAIEHDAVIKTAEALAEQGRAEVTVVGCDARGGVPPAGVGAANRPAPPLVGVSPAKKGGGGVRDAAGVPAGAPRRNPRALVHTDAVQALGKLPVDVTTLGVDLLTVTAHK